MKMRTVRELKKDIKKKISQVNAVSKSLLLSFEEDSWSCEVKNRSLVRGHESTSFGSFQYIALFEDFTCKEDAYQACDAYLDGLLAGVKLLDPKGYHNFLQEMSR